MIAKRDVDCSNVEMWNSPFRIVEPAPLDSTPRKQAVVHMASNMSNVCSIIGVAAKERD